MISFKDKILLITGGTGSFGNAVLRRFLTTDIAEIRILSRDEKKQDDMRHTYQELYPQYAEKIKFYIGDVRDYNSILNAFRGVDYAVDLVLYAFEHGEQGDLFVQKAPAATIETLAQAVLELKHSDLGTTIIGTRHGEKLFEVLVTAEEMMRAEDLPGFFRIPADNRDLNYDNYFSKGNPEFGKIEQYTSHNTHRLNVEEMKQLLLKLKLFGGTC